jgi:hypothetical protein
MFFFLSDLKSFLQIFGSDVAAHETAPPPHNKKTKKTTKKCSVIFCSFSVCEPFGGEKNSRAQRHAQQRHPRQRSSRRHQRARRRLQKLPLARRAQPRCHRLQTLAMKRVNVVNLSSRHHTNKQTIVLFFFFFSNQPGFLLISFRSFFFFFFFPLFKPGPCSADRPQSVSDKRERQSDFQNPKSKGDERCALSVPSCTTTKTRSEFQTLRFHSIRARPKR